MVDSGQEDKHRLAQKRQEGPECKDPDLRAKEIPSNARDAFHQLREELSEPLDGTYGGVGEAKNILSINRKVRVMNQRRH